MLSDPFIKLTNNLKIKKSYLDSNAKLDFTSTNRCRCGIPLSQFDDLKCEYCLALEVVEDV